MSRSGRGFTLIEMLGVLAIMALLSAAAALSLSSARHGADLADTIGQISAADESARILARSSDQPVAIILSLTSGSVVRTQGDTKSTLGHLPGDIKIERMRIGNNSVDYGDATISFNNHGCSHTYAIRLATSVGDHQWIVFAGLTGQRLKVSDDQIDEVLQQISASTGTNAH